MRDNELDRILSQSEEEILPSSGFTASVMEAVQREAAAPPPIPFPWRRALPGVVVAGLVLLLVLYLGITQLGRTAMAPSIAPEWLSFVDRISRAAAGAGIPWVALALLVSYGCVKLSLRLGVRRA